MAIALRAMVACLPHRLGAPDVGARSAYAASSRGAVEKRGLRNAQAPACSNARDVNRASRPVKGRRVVLTGAEEVVGSAPRDSSATARRAAPKTVSTVSVELTVAVEPAGIVPPGSIAARIFSACLTVVASPATRLGVKGAIARAVSARPTHTVATIRGPRSVRICARPNAGAAGPYALPIARTDSVAPTDVRAHVAPAPAPKFVSTASAASLIATPLTVALPMAAVAFVDLTAIWVASARVGSVYPCALMNVRIYSVEVADAGESALGGLSAMGPGNHVLTGFASLIAVASQTTVVAMGSRLYVVLVGIALTMTAF